MDILRIIEPQLEAERIIADALGDCAMLGKAHSEGVARAIIARLADHDPPILLCYPDQIKDGD